VLTGVSSYELDPPSPAEMASRLARVTSAGNPWLIAELDGQPAAYAYAAQFRERPGYARLCEHSVYVAPAAQRAGLARALMLALMPACARIGYTRMLAVIGGPEPSSIALHASLGFTECGRIVRSGRKFGRWLDTVMMERALP
jgi:phosphinothricin acetyltransferase